ncbi:MAG: bifunctional [glutamate--ammonia ligase]-adenylyl-L-tyrosine phosphorylase/[glutamate--ammonia-ligase] adenylyltransferase [Deltaproteobacteria bacterium]|nr:bifunctional [glutamate--ammonia ligase]-adenylyl-L-tyrosine phosphorylase/[glutamate--ammonia-ligase] adenylyltransferase [Deltaproteobacteria bacterium]
MSPVPRDIENPLINLEGKEDEILASLEGLGFSEGRKALHNIKLLGSTPLKGVLSEAITLSIFSPSPDDALNNLETVISRTPAEVVSLFLQEKTNLERLVTICGSSKLLSNTLSKDPHPFRYLFLEGGLTRKKDLKTFLKELEVWTKDALDFPSMAKALRTYRHREFLRIGARDILRLAPMEETTRELSELASVSLEMAYRFCLAQLKREYGTPYYTDLDGSVRESGFVIIGMGKLGGEELNFSSDIDIIYIYSSDKGETTGIKAGVRGQGSGVSNEIKRTGRISLHTFYVKLSEMITKLIGGVTEDGFVFRVDLNLRPEGRSGDLANSLRSAEIYYESWGQTWERGAMLKARPVAGSMRLGEEFLKMLEPFIYRRYLDFTAIEEIKGMKEKIDLSLLRRAPDTVDVKLGGGGIREIEFFVQALQLINGGKDKSIRERNTLKAIEKLKEEGYITVDDANGLREAYIFLRDVEHRIQIVDGRQTHAIPVKSEELERLSKMMGCKDAPSPYPLPSGERIKVRAGEAFWGIYTSRTEEVHGIYEGLFYKPSKEITEGISRDLFLLISDEMGKEAILDKLSGFGFKDVEKAYNDLKLLRDGPPFAHLPERGRVLLGKITPFLLWQVISSPDPDMALGYLERFITSIGARTTFYSLLAENKKVMELLVRLFGTSAFLSRSLIEHPENLDTLLSREINRPYKTKEEMQKELSLLLSPLEEYEEQLDVLRRFRNAEVLRIGINDIFGELDVPTVSRQITNLAEAGLRAAYEMATEYLINRYGRPGGAGFTILGLGKLGGEELTYGSDLDIVFVYSGEEKTPHLPTEKERARLSSKGGEGAGISNHEFFVKLGQRIISILSLVTKEGFFFKVDTRLRPSGSSGPLVTTLDAFLNYHREKARVWERQAMIKARAVAGDGGFGREVVQLLEEVIYGPSLTTDDLKEIKRIGERLELEVARETPARRNIKFGKGGLVDVEFIVRTLQLKFGGERPGLRTPNTIKALERLHREGLLSQGDYNTLKEAYEFYRLIEKRLRVFHDRPEGDIAKGSPELARLARGLGYEDGERLFMDYERHSNLIRAIYEQTLKVGDGE